MTLRNVRKHNARRAPPTTAAPTYNYVCAKTCVHIHTKENAVQDKRELFKRSEILIIILHQIVFLDNLLYDGGVSESGDISQLIMSASCYLPQNTTHYLPGASLGQTWDYL